MKTYKKTYIIEITSEDPDRNAFIKEIRINKMNEPFYNREEAQAFCDKLNDTVAFKYYQQTANIIKEI